MAARIEGFGYDEAGRLAFWRAGDAAVRYEHALDATLLRAGDVRFAHDARGRLDAAVRDGNRVAYEHDARGRRVAAGEARYAWDAHGRLTGWRRGGLSSAMGYDGTGRLVRAVLTGSGRIAEERAYAWEGIGLASFTLARGEIALAMRFERREGRISLVRATLPGGRETILGVAANGRGDVLELLDERGEVFAAYRYGPWGEPLGASTRPTVALDAREAAMLASAMPLRWCGYLWEPAAGLYCCGLRWYDPATCRFLSPDPVRADGTASPYAYCCGDPLDRVDPSGLWGTKVHHTLTREWALEAGFSEEDAAEIARWDYEADHLFPGHRFRYVHHHYSALGARRTARRYLAEALRDRSLRALGFALHSAQDAVGHGVLGPVAHVFHRTIDVWEARPERKRADTKAASMALLHAYREALPTSDELWSPAPAEDEQHAQVDEHVQDDGREQAAGRDEQEAQAEPEE